MGSIALFCSFMLTTVGEKPLEVNSHAHIVSLMYKLISSAKDTDELSIGFDSDCVSIQHELTCNKNRIGKYHVRIMLKDNFGPAEHQEKCAYGLGCEMTF